MKRLAPLVLLLLFASCECEKITEPAIVGDRRVPNGTGGQAVRSSLSFTVPTTGACGNEDAAMPALSYAEIWTGHPVLDAQPFMRFVDTVHVSPGDVVTRYVERDAFVRVRLVDVAGKRGCWLTLGEMYFDKKESKSKVSR